MQESAHAIERYIDAETTPPSGNTTRTTTAPGLQTTVGIKALRR